jgi:hypothetical protein
VTRFLATLVFILGLGTAVTVAEPDPLQFSAIFLETAPLTASNSGPQEYEASLVNVGPNLATGFVLICDSATGICTAPGCQGVLLAPGHGCNAFGTADGPIWARLVLIRFGDKKPINARGSIQIRSALAVGLASEAAPRPGTALDTEL